MAVSWTNPWVVTPNLPLVVVGMLSTVGATMLFQLLLIQKYYWYMVSVVLTATVSLKPAANMVCNAILCRRGNDRNIRDTQRFTKTSVSKPVENAYFPLDDGELIPIVKRPVSTPAQQRLRRMKIVLGVISALVWIATLLFGISLAATVDRYTGAWQRCAPRSWCESLPYQSRTFCTELPNPRKKTPVTQNPTSEP
jgi:hypothetical protein